MKGWISYNSRITVFHHHWPSCFFFLKECTSEWEEVDLGEGLRERERRRQRISGGLHAQHVGLYLITLRS